MVKVRVYVTLKEGVLDPKGITIAKALKALGYQDVREARTGKIIELTLNSSGKKSLGSQVKEMGERLLANPVIEDFSFEVEE